MALSEKSDRLNFKVPINGTEDLMARMELFKKECEAHDKHRRKHNKRRYYQMGLMAKVVCDTTDDELRRLLKNGARTFLIDIVTTRPCDLRGLLARTNEAIHAFEREERVIRIVTGLALEIHGDCCRLGRMRNGCSVLMQRGDTMTLTIDETYKNSCYKQIAYINNLKYYLKTLRLKDTIMLGREVRGRVVKCLKYNIALLIEDSGILNSYEYIELPNQCYALKPESFFDLFQDDLQLAAEAHAHYVVLPKIRCKSFLKALRNNLKSPYDFKLIGSLDLEYISSKMLDLMGIIKLLDYLWIPDMFSVSNNIQSYINDDVVPISKSLKKPIIGTVPLERCSDFKYFENHDFLWKLDTIFIEKSAWCNKYPLIVRKLLPIRDFRMGVVDNCMVLKNILTSYQSIVNFIIRTICSVECQAIFMYTKCEAAAVALGRVEVYCPVYVLLPPDDVEKEDEVATVSGPCSVALARSFNLRRNLHSIMYSKRDNECELKPIDFGIDFMRKCGVVDTGDFVITLEVCKEDEEDVVYGVGEDVVIVRAFYLPPYKPCDSYRYA